MSPELEARARARANELGFKNSFSAYVQKLIEDDLNKGETREGYRLNGSDKRKKKGGHGSSDNPAF